MSSHTFFYESDPGRPKRGRPAKKKDQTIALSAASHDSPPQHVSSQCNILNGEPEIASGPADTQESRQRMSKSSAAKSAVKNETLLTVSEAAVVLRVHPQTVRYWVRIGWLKKTPIGSVRYRIARSEIDRFCAERIAMGAAR